MTQGDTPPYKILAASIALGLAFTGVQAQVPGDSPGGAPQYRDANGVLQPGSGAAGTTSGTGGTWTPPASTGLSPAAAPSTSTGSADSANPQPRVSPADASAPAPRAAPFSFTPPMPRPWRWPRV